MTRKDFNLIAAAVQRTPVLRAADREAIARSLADALAEDNPRFDAEQFIAAATAPMTASTTDTYSVDATRGTLSRRDAILSVVPEEDRPAVSLYANFIMNTSPGYRPSDAAAEAVRQYRLNPDAVRNRQSGCGL